MKTKNKLKIAISALLSFITIITLCITSFATDEQEPVIYTFDKSIEITDNMIEEIVDAIKSLDSEFNLNDYKILLNILIPNTNDALLAFVYHINDKIITNRQYSVKIKDGVLSEVKYSIGNVDTSTVSEEALYERVKFHESTYKVVLPEKLSRYESDYYYDYITNELSFIESVFEIRKSDSGDFEMSYDNVTEIYLYTDSDKITGYYWYRAYNGWANSNGFKFYYKEGKPLTGWQEIDNNKYYFNENGEMINKNTTINEIRYTFSSDGICTGKYTGWTISDEGRRYYLNGEITLGWKTINKEKYYFNNKGIAFVGEHVIDGLIYVFNDKGKWNKEEPKKFFIKETNYSYTEYGKIMYKNKIYKTYDEINSINLKELTFIGTIKKVKNRTLSNDFDASFYPEGTLLYLCDDGDIIAVNNNSFFSDKKITLLSTDYSKKKNSNENISNFPENDNVNHRLYYNKQLYSSGTYIQLNLLTIEGIKSLEFLGFVDKISINPSNDYESSYFPINSKIYKYDENKLIIVYYDWVGTEHAVMSKPIN